MNEGSKVASIVDWSIAKSKYLKYNIYAMDSQDPPKNTQTFYQITDLNKLNIMSVVAPAHGETINGAECPNN